MVLTTLCYIEKDGKYLMLYRNKKRNDLNKGKWIGVGGKLLEGDRVFLELLEKDAGYFSLKLRYQGEKLAEVIKY